MKPLKNSSLIETKLLLILEAVLTEKNITRAANKLQTSQPAVSAALKKIRHELGDPLVVSDGKTLIPTARAERIHEQLKRTLLDIQNIVSDKKEFDPEESTETFKIAATDNIAHYFFTHLFKQLHKKAPNINIEIISFGQDYDAFEALKLGNADVAVGNWVELPDNLHCNNLYTDKIVCLMRKEHPYAKGITKQQYFEGSHVVPSPYSVGKRGVVDNYLSRHRLKRNVTVTVPFFNIAPYALMETDLIFTVNHSLAQLFAREHNLEIVEAPLPYPIVNYVQLWHERTHKSHALIWLRQEISTAAKALQSELMA